MKNMSRFLPFDSHELIDPETEDIIFDRAARAKELADWLRTYFSDGVLVSGGGVLSTELKVTKTKANQLSVDVGNIVIHGRTGFLDSPEIIALSPTQAGNTRIDRVVAELNTKDPVRSIRIGVVSGTESSSPTAPDLTRTITGSGDSEEIIWQLSLAKIIVSNSGIDSIQDERPDVNLCGISQVLIGVRPPIPVTGDSADNISYDDKNVGITAATVQIALDKIYEFASRKGNLKAFDKINVVIPVNSWVATSDYTKAKFKAQMNFSDVTINYNAEVYFSPNDADSGIFSGGGIVGDGYIIILAKAKPETDITIPLIRFEKVVS